MTMSLTDYNSPRNSYGPYPFDGVQAGEPRYPERDDSVTADSSGAAKKTTAPHRVLICEDQRDAAETLAALLRFEGHEICVAHDGPSAIAQARHWRPTVAIIDIGLPGVTGYAVAQSIRELPDGAAVLLIAITGYGTPADVEMARYAGFNWHFAKPAHPSFIAEVMKDPNRAQIHRRDGVPLRRTPSGRNT